MQDAAVAHEGSVVWNCVQLTPRVHSILEVCHGCRTLVHLPSRNYWTR